MPHLRSSLLAGIALAAAVFTAAAASDAPSPAPAPLYDPQAVPAGPVGDAIRLGHDIFDDPQKYLPKNVTARMSCSACHLNAGTVVRGGSLAGAYGRFPQWNKRAGRVIALQDRLAECFLYSMNGTPPAYSSKEMVALVAYIAYLSRNVPIGAPQPAGETFTVAVPSTPPDIARGGSLYGQRCIACHRGDGDGLAGAVPPLWGPHSFNDKAGMAQLTRMTGFVMYNMPQNAPGTLSLRDAYDIAGWVLSHPRPKFDPARQVTESAQRADFF
jgi:thiosulfate dehydrogenase